MQKDPFFLPWLQGKGYDVTLRVTLECENIVGNESTAMLFRPSSPLRDVSVLSITPHFQFGLTNEAKKTGSQK